VLLRWSAAMGERARRAESSDRHSDWDKKRLAHSAEA
jgi:hypothetical protein